VAPGIEADLRVVPHSEVGVGRDGKNRTDGRDGTQFAAGREGHQVGLAQQSDVAGAQDVAHLAQVDAICRVEHDAGVPPVIRCHDDDLGKCPRIDALSVGRGTGRESQVVPVDLVFDVLTGKPVEQRFVGSVEGGPSIHRRDLLHCIRHPERGAKRAPHASANRRGRVCRTARCGRARPRRSSSGPTVCTRSGRMALVGTAQTTETEARGRVDAMADRFGSPIRP
jgi:hypothetical protein